MSIRTRFSIEELNDIMKFPDCPCPDGHISCDCWDMWIPTGRIDTRWLASMYGEDRNDLYYKYKDHVFVAHWEGVDESIGHVTRYIKSIEDRLNEYIGQINQGTR